MFETGAGLKVPYPKSKIIMGVAMAVLVLVLAIGGYFFWQSSNKDKETVNQETIDRIVGKVGAFYELPQETPTVAEIKDQDKLKDQAFFEKAQTGDYLILYSEAKTAMIYRESTNKLINVGPVSFNNKNNSNKTEVTPPTP